MEAVNPVHLVGAEEEEAEVVHPRNLTCVVVVEEEEEVEEEQRD